MNTLKFQDREYSLREINLPDIGTVTISTVELNDALLNSRYDYVSEEAQVIDEGIYFFVEEEEIGLEESKLSELIALQTV